MFLSPLPPLTVTSPPTVILSGFTLIPDFAVCSLSITSPTSPWIPPPLVPPLIPTIAPPAFKSVLTSLTFRFPPISTFPFPVSDPNTPPFRLASPSTLTVISFLALIPAWVVTSLPFLKICPPPAESPRSPVPIVFVATPAETSAPNQASILDSSILSTLVSIFKSPPTFRSTLFPSTVLPMIFVSFPDSIVTPFLATIELPLLYSLFTSDWL